MNELSPVQFLPSNVSLPGFVHGKDVGPIKFNIFHLRKIFKGLARTQRPQLRCKGETLLGSKTVNVI
jgi:hypothetical protein